MIVHNLQITADEITGDHGLSRNEGCTACSVVPQMRSRKRVVN
eukprot:CAMPEP_0203792062 /NCGR_PEP_ID=MMETSP0100_2-20121128/5010_1 /ASSEMBLY_ACC=CAM_ASM_000210 /TAXON_ID=96639 /ORGANISM=" , Strain NY0313808BC1" /LENGTH=42 /DNA_ID= /DNA_START= /DNA_END= /DNA_ORIENTATION=